MRYKINEIQPNPYRDLETFPLVESQLQELQRSISSTGFWDNVLGRVVNDIPQLAYGHHRLEAARRVLGDNHEIELIVRDISDADMIRIMNDENARNRATVLALHESVRAVVLAYARGAIELGPLPRDASHNQLRHAPSFILGNPIPHDVSGDRPYTGPQIHDFLKWSGTHYNKVNDVLGALALIEEGYLRQSDFDNLNQSRASAIVAEARNARTAVLRAEEQARQQTLRAQRAEEQRQQAEVLRAQQAEVAREAEERRQQYEREEQEQQRLAHEERIQQERERRIQLAQEAEERRQREADRAQQAHEAEEQQRVERDRLERERVSAEVDQRVASQQVQARIEERDRVLEALPAIATAAQQSGAEARRIAAAARQPITPQRPLPHIDMAAREWFRTLHKTLQPEEVNNQKFEEFLTNYEYLSPSLQREFVNYYERLAAHYTQRAQRLAECASQNSIGVS